MDEQSVDIADLFAADFTGEHLEYCDACDGSGARVEAFVFAELPSGRSVAYCAHHGTKYLERLSEIALVVVDHRHLVPA